MKLFRLIAVVMFVVILAASSRSGSASNINLPAAGKLLVADLSLQDPRFVQSIVLIFRYGDDGAAGLILNHPTQAEINKLFPEIPGVKERKELIHFGGPVSTDSVFVLMQSREPDHKVERVFENIFLSTDLSLMRNLLGKKADQDLLRFYLGYAGWGPGQLNQEIERGFWHVLPADSKAVFHSNPSKIWREFFEKSKIIQANLHPPPFE